MATVNNSSPDLPQTADHLIFSNFFNCWLSQQGRNLTQLHSIVDSGETEANTRLLVGRVIGNYEYYYHAKTAFARQDVQPMFTPTWTSQTNNPFIWVGGWRPATAFHILYSKCTMSLGGLSAQQLERVDALHGETVRLEEDISEEVAGYQVVGEQSRGGRVENGGGFLMEHAAMAGDVEKVNKMKGVSEIADMLRLNTLKRIVENLDPMQAVHFLIAFTELLLPVHESGRSMDFSAKGTAWNHRRPSLTDS